MCACMYVCATVPVEVGQRTTGKSQLFSSTMYNPGIKLNLSGFGCKLLHLLNHLAHPMVLFQIPKLSVGA